VGAGGCVGVGGMGVSAGGGVLMDAGVPAGVEVGVWVPVSIAAGMRVGVRVGLEVRTGTGRAWRRLTLPQIYDDTEQHEQIRQQMRKSSA